MSDNLSVSGGPLAAGVGLVSVTTTVITAHAASTSLSAAKTAVIADDLKLIATDPILWASAACDPVGAARVAEKIMAAGLGPQGVVVRAAELSALSASLLAAALSYEATEGRVSGAMDRTFAKVNDLLVSGLSWPGGQWGALVLTAENMTSELSDAAYDMARGKPINEAVSGAAKDFMGEESEIPISMLPALFGPPFTAKHAAAVVTGVMQGVGLGTAGYRLQVSQSVSAQPLRLQPGVKGMVAGLDRVNAPDCRDAVSVVTIHKPGEPPRYVVNLPGTVDWFDKKHPCDANSNAQSKAGLLSDAERLARSALNSIPAGAPVMFTGYSQGGIIAAKLAADPQLRQRFNVKGVLTLGSPTADVLPRLPGKVTVMSIEHRDDPVPMLDRRRAIPSDTHYVTRVDAPHVADGILQPHAYGNYRHTFDRLAASGDPSARSYTRSVQDFQAVPGTTATYSEWKGERVKSP